MTKEKEHDPISLALDDKAIPESVLPAQLLQKPPSSPEKSLLLAVFQSAHDDFRTSGHRGIIQETLTWLHSEEEDYLFSFISICNHLNIDPARTREKFFTSMKHYLIRRDRPNVTSRTISQNKRAEYQKREKAKRRAL